MEIDRTAAARPQHLTPVPPSVPAGTSPAASEREAAEARLDRIELSTAAREITGDPGADREAKLAALRAQVEAGTYRVDAAGVARLVVASDDL